MTVLKLTGGTEVSEVYVSSMMNNVGWFYVFMSYVLRMNVGECGCETEEPRSDSVVVCALFVSPRSVWVQFFKKYPQILVSGRPHEHAELDIVKSFDF